MDPKEREIRLKLKNNFLVYAKKCLRIRTKDGEVVPFKLNDAQEFIHKKLEQQLAETGKVRAIILKGRQQGCSTYTEGRFYWKVTHSPGVRAFILTHDQEATNNLFEMAQRYHANCPELVRPSVGSQNAKELDFPGIDSGYKVGTAGNKAVGRSSTVQLFHGSEVGFWPNAAEHAKGIMQAVPNSDKTEIILESTANGIGNYFHQQWQLAEAGQSKYIAIFIPWFWQKEYSEKINGDFIITSKEMEIRSTYSLTNQQLEWRRNKIQELSVNGADGEKAFKQEYPCSATEAFQTTGDDSFISPDVVMKARKGSVERVGKIIMGVDPARFGDDRTSIVFRQGREIYGIISYSKLDTMEVVGHVHKLIKEKNPHKVFIDVGGLGAGIVDRFKELGLGDKVKGVNSGSSPLDQDIYYNKRAEMWGEMKKWLLDEPVSIPDLDSLHSDLCAPSYRFDSKTRLLLEKKEDMKKRGLRSPDEGDAAALTFAFPSVNEEFDINYFLNPSVRI